MASMLDEVRKGQQQHSAPIATVFKAGWDEALHPRGEHGHFMAVIGSLAHEGEHVRIPTVGHHTLKVTRTRRGYTIEGGRHGFGRTIDGDASEAAHHIEVMMRMERKSMKYTPPVGIERLRNIAAEHHRHRTGNAALALAQQNTGGLIR